MSPVSGCASIVVRVLPLMSVVGGSPIVVGDPDIHATDDAMMLYISKAVSVIAGNPNSATDALLISDASTSAASRSCDLTPRTSLAEEKNLCWRTIVIVIRPHAIPATAVATSSSATVNPRLSHMALRRGNDRSLADSALDARCA